MWHEVLKKPGGLFSEANLCRLVGSQLEVCVKTWTSLNINVNHTGVKQDKDED